LIQDNQKQPLSSSEFVSVTNTYRDDNIDERTILTSIIERLRSFAKLMGDILAVLKVALFILVTSALVILIGLHFHKAYINDQQVIDTIYIGRVTSIKYLKHDSFLGSSIRTVIETGGGTYLVDGAISAEINVSLEKRTLRSGHSELCNTDGCWAIDDQGMEAKDRKP
jgi:hypothetical protein